MHCFQPYPACKEYVVLGAHYDTEWKCPGAGDNATGIALAYMVAKEMSKLPQRKRNLILVFFDQEEEELIGSQAFAQFLQQQEWTIHSVHTIDMVSWDEDGDRLIEIERPTAELMALYQSVATPWAFP